MHNYIIIASITLPLIGIIQMEDGAYGNSIGLRGHPNGAAKYYLYYALILLLSYSVTYKYKKKEKIAPNKEVRNLNIFIPYSIALILLVIIPSLIIMLFYFGGWDVWIGEIAKGEFKVNLGRFGAAAYLMTNAVVPICVSYVTILYQRSPRSWKNKLLLILIFIGTILVGSTWGFKSTGITMLFPALLILLWNSSLKQILIVTAISILIIIVFFWLFDSNTTEAQDGLIFLWTRLTTLQGDVSWELWNQYENKVEFPSYVETLKVFIGNKFFSLLTGITRDMPSAWANHHFDILIGLQIALPIDTIHRGHSVVGTPFSDGLIMGGLFGVLSIALFTGTLIGYICRTLERLLQGDNVYFCALLATYFGIYVLTFLRNGAAIQLFHIATLTGLMIGSIICIFIDYISRAFLKNHSTGYDE